MATFEADDAESLSYVNTRGPSMERSMETLSIEDNVGEPVENLSPIEVEKLMSLRSRRFIPDKDIPSIGRRLSAILEMREEEWTINPPGIDNSFPTQNPTDPIKMLLVGVGGVGKSRLGSVLVGGNETVFKSSDRVKAETQEVKRADFEFDGQRFAVFDTPGYVIKEIMENESRYKSAAVVLTEVLLWPVNSQDAQKTAAHKAIREGLHELGDGVHVIAFIMSAGNGRTYETDIKIMHDAMVLNPKTFNHCMIVVTHCQSKYAEGGREQLLKNIKLTTRVIQLLEDIHERVVLVDLGNGESLSARTLDTYSYECQQEQVRKMVMAMASKVVEDNRKAGRAISYPRKLLDSDLEICFPSKAMVYTADGNKVMKDLRLYDNVLVVDACGLLTYEPVIFFTHKSADEQTTFVSITTENGNVLQLSSGHLLPIGELGTLKAAHQVRIGDVVFAVGNAESVCAVAEKVVAVGSEQLNGLYCPHTPSSSIVVDGIVASCYTDLVPTMVAHGALLPVRILHCILSTEWFTWIHEHSYTQRILSTLRSVVSIWQ